MAGHAGVNIYHTETSVIPLNRIPMSSVEYAHERDSTRDIPRESFLFDYILNYGEQMPTWAKPGRRIGVVSRVNGRVLFLGRLEIPGITPIGRGRSRMRVRAVSDLDRWADRIINERSTGASMGTPSSNKSAFQSWLNGRDTAQTAPRLTSASTTITASTVAQSGVYWAEGATLRELIARFGYSNRQPFIGVKSPTWTSRIDTLYYTVTTGTTPLITSDTVPLSEGKVELSGEWRFDDREIVNQVDVGEFKTATNINTPESSKSEITFGKHPRVVSSSVLEMGARSIEAPTYWTWAAWTSRQGWEDGWNQLAAEIADAAILTEVPPISPAEITLSDISPGQLGMLKAGCTLTMAGNHPYKAIGNRYLKATILTVKAKPNLTNRKTDSWTATLTVAAQPNRDGGGGLGSFEGHKFRWRDYTTDWNHV